MGAATIKTGDPVAWPTPPGPPDPDVAVPAGRILAPTGYTFIGESPTFSLTVCGSNPVRFVLAARLELLPEVAMAEVEATM